MVGRHAGVNVIWSCHELHNKLVGRNTKNLWQFGSYLELE